MDLAIADKSGKKNRRLPANWARTLRLFGRDQLTKQWLRAKSGVLPARFAHEPEPAPPHVGAFE